VDEAFAMAADVPEVVAVGVNCVDPADVPELVSRAAALSGRPAVAYPNSGETWDALGRAWHGPPTIVASSVQQWTAAGARLVGGCCRVLPETIAAVGAAAGAR
jgi:homocysteine S-methyltransferase